MKNSSTVHTYNLNILSSEALYILTLRIKYNSVWEIGGGGGNDMIIFDVRKEGMCSPTNYIVKINCKSKGMK